MQRTISLAVAMLLLVMLAACGGGFSDEGTALCADGTTTSSAGKQGACSHHGGLATRDTGGAGASPGAPNSTASALTAHLVRPLIAGASYTNNYLSGGPFLTSSTGEYFVGGEGSTIRFRLGGIALFTIWSYSASTPQDSLYSFVRPTDATLATATAAENLMAFLMAVDDDADSTNGIQLNTAVRNAAEGRSVNFNQTSVAFYADPNVQAVVLDLSGLTARGRRALPPAAQAKAAI